MQKPIVFAHKKAPSESSQFVFLYGLPIFAKERKVCEKILNRLLRRPAYSPFLIFTPNLEMLSGAKAEPRIRHLLLKADLLLPDGIGVRIVSGFKIKERIPGIEIGEFLLSLASARGYRVFFLGGKPGVADAAALRLRRRFPALNVVGTHHGYFQETEEAAVTQKIRSAAPDILFVCTGFPRQEAFLVRNRSNLGGLRLAVGLGGSLDVWAGSCNRAPVLCQKLGLEWLYRALKEPERIPRLIGSLQRLLRRPSTLKPTKPS